MQKQFKNMTRRIMKETKTHIDRKIKRNKNMFMKRKQEQDKIVKERNKVRKYLHECILQEGSILEVKENVPPWDLK